jgi:3-methyladenine DNA glycosylase AlkD
MLTLNKLKKELKSLANSKQAEILQRFFKTGPGEYGEGDIFYGIKVPEQRKLVKKYYSDLQLPEIQVLVKSKIHEERLVGLLILVEKFKRASEEDQARYYKFYLKHAKYVNNWDLVDLTAPHIVGVYLLHKSRKILYILARSRVLWERRIAILACFTFIRASDYEDALKISRILLSDEHDLIHKAVGWMLREIGKRDQQREEEFLKKHFQIMPRTMLRYAIERFDERKRKYYLGR